MRRSGEKIPVFVKTEKGKTQGDIRDVVSTLSEDFFLADIASAHRPGILIHEVDPKRGDKAISDLMTLRASGQVSHTVVVVSGPGTPGFYEDLVSAGGISGMCSLPLDCDKVIRILKKCAKAGAGKRGGGGKAICLMGCRGGTGNTTIALNLAWALSAGHPEKVLLVDFSAPYAEMPIRLNMDLVNTWNGLSGEMGAMDRGFFLGSLTPCVDGSFFVLPGEEDNADTPTPEDASSMLSFGTENFDFVVIDARMGYDDLSTKLAEACDATFLTASALAPHMREMNRCLTFLQDTAPGSMNRIHSLINMFDGSMTKQDIEYVMEKTGKKPRMLVRHDPKPVIKSINDGKSVFQVKPESVFAKDIEALASMMSKKPNPSRKSGEKKKKGKK